MSNSTITDSFIRQFRDLLEHECRQMQSGLRQGVTEVQVVGKDLSIERVTDPTDDMAVVAGRDEATVLDDMNHSRRVASMVSFRSAVSINHEDKLRLLIDPQSAYVMELAGRFNRTLDQKIIAATLGTASTGETGSGTQTLGSAQQETSGTTMTLAKLQAARLIMLKGFVDLDREDVNLFINGAGYTALSQSTGVTSNLNVNYQVNVDGKIGMLAGFDIMACEALTRATGTYTGSALSSTSRPAILMAKSAVTLGVGEDINSYVEPRPDLWGLTQARIHATYGAVRVHEPKVVDIRFQE